MTYTITSVNGKVVLTPELPNGVYTVNYNVNLTGTPTDHTPTVQKLATYSDIVDARGNDFEVYTVLSPSYTDYSATSDNLKDNNRSNYQFAGWIVNGNEGTIIEAGSRLTAQQLADLATDRSVSLTAKWVEQATNITVNFYVNTACEVVDQETGTNTGGLNTNYYTPSVTSAKVSISTATQSNLTADYITANYADIGVTRHKVGDGYEYIVITENSADTAATDETIHSLYDNEDGYTLEGVQYKLDAFPSDAEVLAAVQKMVTNGQTTIYLTEDDRTNQTNAVKAEDLTTTNFAVRWYVFKWGGDVWHVDGVLVERKGMIVVEKEFYGYADAITAVKNGYSIDVTTGDTTTTLELSEDNYDSATGKYRWKIETKRDTEYTVTEKNYTYTADQTIKDLDIASLAE